jgi:hypothetical protein
MSFEKSKQCNVCNVLASVRKIMERQLQNKSKSKEAGRK